MLFEDHRRCIYMSFFRATLGRMTVSDRSFEAGEFAVQLRWLLCRRLSVKKPLRDVVVDPDIEYKPVNLVYHVYPLHLYPLVRDDPMDGWRRSFQSSPHLSLGA